MFKCLMIQRMKCNLNAICFCISVLRDQCFYPGALALVSAGDSQDFWDFWDSVLTSGHGTVAGMGL